NQHGFTLEKEATAIDEIKSKITQQQAAASKAQAEAQSESLKTVSNSLGALKVASPALQPVLYQALREQAAQQNPAMAKMLPPQWDEQAAQIADTLHTQTLSALDRIKAGQETEKQTAVERKNAADELARKRQLEIAQQQANTSAFQAQTSRGQLALGQQRYQAESAQVNLSPKAMEEAATRYNRSAELPATGRGKQGAIVRSQIMNRAADAGGGLDLPS